MGVIAGGDEVKKDGTEGAQAQSANGRANGERFFIIGKTSAEVSCCSPTSFRIPSFAYFQQAPHAQSRIAPLQKEYEYDTYRCSLDLLHMPCLE